MAISMGAILGANLLGSLFATHQGAKANNAIRSDMNKQIADLEGLFAQERDRDPFSRPDVQAALSQIREGLRDSTKVHQGNAIRTGATAEKQVAAGAGAGKVYSDSVTGILGMDSRRREHAQNRLQNMIMGLKGQDMQMAMADAQKWPQLMQNLGGLSSAAIDVLGAPKPPID